VMEDITACLRKAEDDLSKAVLLCAKGSIFSYGLDVEDLMEHENPQKVLDALRRMIDSFIRFPKPIIAAVQGPCASLGASILGLCDLVVASNKAAIQMPYTLQGLTPDSCSSYLLPTIVGAQQANSLLLGNKILTAFEAHQIGYFTEVVSHEELMGSVMNHMNSLRFAALPNNCLERHKNSIHSLSAESMYLACEFACEVVCKLITKFRMRNFYISFFSKRKKL
uniref:Uncharacterized protein n=1 Tax=Ciona intestinalis TaxID=7719 RepID=H2XVL0_CIOIN